MVVVYLPRRKDTTTSGLCYQPKPEPTSLHRATLVPLHSGGMEGVSLDEAAADDPVRDTDTAEFLWEPGQAAKVIEIQKDNQELREELQKARDDYNMATGTISSLQRQLEIQESQQRRCKSEKEMLQRKLRERENELQALFAKFCSLREEQEQTEMMVAMEKENRSLRQVVTELESKLVERNELISELQGTVRRLQAEVLSSQHQIRMQRRDQEVLQSQAEALQHRMLQTTVALESITSKFERYRNKIIQDTFRTAGSKPPQAEVTDEEVLEALQKIITERMEFLHMLKQKGIRVPSPYAIERSASPISAKGKKKSPARRRLSVNEKP